CGKQSIRTRTGASLMRAWLQVDVHGGRTRPVARLLQSQNLGVLQAIVSVRTGSHDFAVVAHDHGADIRVGRSEPDTTPRQAECLAQKFFVRVVIAHDETGPWRWRRRESAASVSRFRCFPKESN